MQDDLHHHLQNLIIGPLVNVPTNKLCAQRQKSIQTYQRPSHMAGMLPQFINYHSLSYSKNQKLRYLIRKSQHFAETAKVLLTLH